MSFYKELQQPFGSPGLFYNSENVDEDSRYYDWGSAGIFWNSMIQYAHLTGDTQYSNLISEGLVFQVGKDTFKTQRNNSNIEHNGDQAMWGLAALTAAETGLKDPEGERWIDIASNLFDIFTLRWGNMDTCGGGLKQEIYPFQMEGIEFMDTETNGAFFLLSARLAKATGNETYAQWAEKSWDWSVKVGFVNKENGYSVGSALDLQDAGGCDSVFDTKWSISYGLYTEAVAVMHSLVRI